MYAVMHPREIEDAPIKQTLGAFRRTKVIIRNAARAVVFSSRSLRNLARKFSGAKGRLSGAEWDTLLSTTSAVTYLGGTLDVALRDAVTSTLVKDIAGSEPSVLDIGCAAGSLASSLSFSSYLGVDISGHAIDIAASRFKRPNIAFVASDLCLLPLVKLWDVIIFNEVLYYMDIDLGVAEVGRYAKSLSDAGTFLVSMKDDPKSRVIFRELSKRYRWVNGAVWQRKPLHPNYRISISREYPGYLIGAFKIS
jgi:SAM-dependent methyltransferase